MEFYGGIWIARNKLIFEDNKPKGILAWSNK